jgi:hypothetical protein
LKFHKAFLTLIASFAGLSIGALGMTVVFAFVLDFPFLGFILLVIVVPLVSGFLAGRFVILRDTLALGGLGGLFWSTLEITLFLVAIYNVPMVAPVKIGAWEIAIFAVVTILNCLLSFMGCRISAKPNALLAIKPAGEMDEKD